MTPLTDSSPRHIFSVLSTRIEKREPLNVLSQTLKELGRLDEQKLVNLFNLAIDVWQQTTQTAVALTGHSKHQRTITILKASEGSNARENVHALLLHVKPPATASQKVKEILIQSRNGGKLQKPDQELLDEIIFQEALLAIPGEVPFETLPHLPTSPNRLTAQLPSGQASTRPPTPRPMAFKAYPETAPSQPFNPTLPPSPRETEAKCCNISHWFKKPSK